MSSTKQAIVTGRNSSRFPCTVRGRDEGRGGWQVGSRMRLTVMPQMTSYLKPSRLLRGSLLSVAMPWELTTGPFT